MREPHLHLTVYFGKSSKFFLTHDFLVPDEGHYIDPIALFRGRMPIDTHAMRALSGEDKQVRIAYRLRTGETVPPDAKIIWPFDCDPR
jgi:hypothetical protein